MLVGRGAGRSKSLPKAAAKLRSWRKADRDTRLGSAPFTAEGNQDVLY